MLNDCFFIISENASDPSNEKTIIKNTNVKAYRTGKPTGSRNPCQILSNGPNTNEKK